MKRLKDMSNDEKFDLMLDLYDIYAQIMADDKVQEAFKTGDTKTILKAIIDNQRDNAIKMCAVRHGVPVEEYKIGVFTLPNVLSELILDGTADFFGSQEKSED